MCTLIALVALGLVVAGCAVAATPPSLPELEGVWGGRMFGPSGNAAASLTLKAGGTYTGTMFLDAGDRSVHGRIVTTPSGQLRHVSTEGEGRVIVDPAPGGTLRFVGGGDGAGGVFSRQR